MKFDDVSYALGVLEMASALVWSHVGEGKPLGMEITDAERYDDAVRTVRNALEGRTHEGKPAMAFPEEHEGRAQ